MRIEILLFDGFDESEITSVCTGPPLLAAGGLTAGRPATTHGSALEDLRDSGALAANAPGRVGRMRRAWSTGVARRAGGGR